MKLMSRHYFYVLIALVVLVLSISASAQGNSSVAPAFSPEDFRKYSGVFAAFGRVIQQAQGRIELPAPRSQSRLLPLLPESTIFYAAFSNYGEASHQLMKIFQDELRGDAELRKWWTTGEMATQGPKIEESLEKYYQLCQYLGDEVVISAADREKQDPAVLMLAEVRKPGLKDFLQQSFKLAGNVLIPRVLDASELATVKDSPGPAVLVLPDLLVAASDLATLRHFNEHLDHKNQEFLSTAFGQRLAHSYDGGLTGVAGADVQRVLRNLPANNGQSQAIFERTGFSDMKHLVWEHKNIDGQMASQLELSFIGPRRSIASWLSSPGPMPSLDFVSPKATLVSTILLKSPAAIFDDIRELSTASNPNTFAAIMQAEQALKVNFREDLFNRLGGEVTVEMSALGTPNPAWKLILQVNDPSGLLATLRSLLLASHITPVEMDEDAVTYHTIQSPSGQNPRQITYAMVDRYLIVGSSRESVVEAVQVHRSGSSLATSPKFQKSLPSGNLAQSSAILYEDPMAIAAVNLRRISPELADSLKSTAAEAPMAVIFGYGDESALREVNRTQSFDLGATLVVAAVAIPNLLRARMAANESSAVATIRTANTGQIAYSMTYPQRGYAHDLAALGPDPAGSSKSSAQHAGFVDATIGNASCTAGAWCIKSGYKFTITTSCRPQQPCKEYVVLATPFSNSTGTRSFCSTSDAIIRFQLGTPPVLPITAAECRRWMLLP